MLYMSYDYEFPEGLRIADINNNRKVGTIDRRFIQSGNNVASGFARPEPFPLGSPAMGGAGSGGKFNLGRAIKHGVSSVGNTVVKVATPVATKMAQQHLEKALTSMLESGAESAAAGAGMTGGKRGFKSFAKSVVNHPAVKSMATQAIHAIAPHVKNMAEKFLNDALQGATAPSETPVGGKFNIGRSLKHLGSSVVSVAAPVVSKVAQAHLEKAVNEMFKSGAEASASGAGMAGGKRGFKAFAKSVISHPEVKKFASHAVSVIAPHVKDMADKMLNQVIQTAMESGSSAPAGGKFNLGHAFKKVGSTLGRTAASLAPKVLPVALGSLAMATGNPELAIPASMLGEESGKAIASKYGRGLRPRGRPRLMEGGKKFNLGRALKKGVSSVGHTLGNVATGVGTQYLVNALTNPAVDEALAEGAMVALGRPRGRPRKAGGAMMRLGADPRTYTPRAIGGIGVGFRNGKMVKMTDVARGGARSGGARGAIVSRIMRERGCSLPQASSIVKAEGLY